MSIIKTKGKLPQDLNKPFIHNKPGKTCSQSYFKTEHVKFTTPEKSRSRSPNRMDNRLSDHYDKANTRSSKVEITSGEMDTSRNDKRRNPGDTSERYNTLVKSSEEEEEYTDISPNLSPEKTVTKKGKMGPNYEENFPPLGATKSDPISASGISEACMETMIRRISAEVRKDLQANLEEIKSTLEANYNKFKREIHKKIDEHEERLYKLENSAKNSNEDIRYLSSEIQKLKIKLADQENRSRRNNIKIRGISEDITQEALPTHIKDIFRKAIPTLTDSELIIDRAHRIPKPTRVSADLPRDTILRIHFYNTKEKILQYLKKEKTFPEPYRGLKMFADLSKDTLDARRSFNNITATLREEGIPYNWGFPLKLLVRHKGRTIPLFSVDDGTEFIKSLKGHKS
ncbi:uncharacterized protein [Dendrobates tinctorius]|uniref:uncharacterized protein n=1 Tax=Dendrobates tinctorius TaxID=92724 RepID=UPI003CC9BE4A